MHSHTGTSDPDRLAAFRRTIFRGLAMRKITVDVVDDSGSRPIVVVDEHARVSEVMAQSSRTGGFANLFVVMDDSSVVRASIIPSDSALLSDDADSVKIEHRDSEIGLLIHATIASENGLNVAVRLQHAQADVRNARVEECLN